MAGYFNSRPFLVLFALFVFLFLAPFAWAQEATIQISKFPEAVVADGSSTVTLSIQVRNRNGSNVPDGTQVVIESTLGSVRPNVVTTKDGFAQTVLTAGQISGLARITASAVSFRATTVIEVLFAKNRAELEDDQFSVEISAPNRLTYSPERRVIRADGPGQLVLLKSRNLEILADDLQYDLRSNVIIAKRAKVTSEGETTQFLELALNVKELTGFGVATFDAMVPNIRPAPRLFSITFEPRRRIGPVNFAAGKITPRVEALPTGAFTFADMDGDITLVYARQATIYPTREVLFRSATVDIQGSKVLRGIPLFRVSTQSVRPVLTEEFIQVNNNQLNVDFPYYLDLKAGSSSNFRFRYGTRYGRGFGAASGMFLDFERNWTFGNDQRGFFAVQGIARNDWGLTARQNLKFGSSGNAYLQADFPGNRALVGSLSADHRVGRIARANFNLNASKTIRGSISEAFDQTLTVRRDPQRLGKLPATINYGIIGSMREFKSEFTDTATRYVGADLQILMSSRKVGAGTLNASTRLSKLWGYNVREGLTTGFTTSYSTPLSQRASANITYDFSDDFFSSSTIGKHRISGDLYFDLGRLYFFTFGSKSLDVDRFNLQNDLSYRFSDQWRAGFSSTLDGFQGTSYSDFGVVIAYNLGLREVGISWSQRSKRIGLEILGTPIR